MYYVTDVSVNIFADNSFISANEIFMVKLYELSYHKDKGNMLYTTYKRNPKISCIISNPNQLSWENMVLIKVYDSVMYNITRAIMNYLNYKFRKEKI